MHRSLRSRVLLPGVALGVAMPLTLGGGVGAETYRTYGEGTSFDVGWTEYDPDDLLGLPGNVHVGYLYAESGAYGSYVFGGVTDFECDEGESPWGGGHVVEVAAEGADVIDGATEDTIDDIIDSGADTIDAGAVVDGTADEVADELGEAIVEEYEEEFPACDYLQDRFLDGTGTTTLTVRPRARIARLTGSLSVSNGGHGEPGDVIATPPVDITVTGGDWERYEYFSSSSSASADWRFSYEDWQRGTRYNGGEVAGRIGAMGLADDPDDSSWAGFGTYKYRTVEKVR